MRKPGARVGDDHTCPVKGHAGGPIISGSPNVFYNGKSAARVTDLLECHPKDDVYDEIAAGSNSVYVNGLPAARMGDGTKHGGVITEGSATVFIGERAIGTEGKADQTTPCAPANGHPVNPIKGCKLLPGITDFSLPAPKPFTFTRGYLSSNNTIGILGQGWSVTGNLLRLVIETEPETSVAEEEPPESHIAEGDTQSSEPVPNIFVLDASGRRIKFSLLEPAQKHFSEFESFWLLRGGEELPNQNDPLLSGVPRSIQADENHYFVATGEYVFVLSPLSDGQWHTTSEFSLAGYHTQYDRDGSGLLSSVIDSAGRHYRFEYQTYPAINEKDSGKRLTKVTLNSPALTLVSFDYTATGDLARVKDRAGRTTHEYEWQNHILTAYKIPGQLEMRYEWDEAITSGKVIKQIQTGGLTHHYTYHDDHTEVTDSLNRTERFYFKGESPKQRWSKHQRADGSTIKYHYTATGQRTFIRDPLDRLTVEQRDHLGMVSGIRYPNGKHSDIFRDDLGRVTQYFAPNRKRVRYQYGASGELISQTDALKNKTTFEYSNSELPDLPTKKVDPEGASHQYAWNRYGQLIKHTDCSGNTSEVTYNELGQTTEQSDALGNTVRFQYSDDGLQDRVNYPEGFTQYHYDEHRRLVALEDSEGIYLHYSLDDQGRIISETDAEGSVRKLEYDIAGRLTKITNANGAEHNFEYDEMDRLIKEKTFSGQSHRYEYNSVGELIKHTELLDSQERSHQFHYDTMGQLITRDIPATDKTPAHREQYYYDEVGQLICTDNLYARVEWEYDNAGQTALERQIHKDPSLALQVAETTQNYNERREELEDKQYDAQYEPLPEDQIVWQWENRFSYNAQGVPEFTQQGEERLEWLTYGSGHLLGLKLNNLQLSIKPDALHREVQREVHSLHASNPIIRTDHRFSHMGQLRERRFIYPGADPELASQNHFHSYQYDSRLHLSGHNHSVHRWDELATEKSTEENTIAPSITADVLTYQQSQYQYDTVGRLVKSAHKRPRTQESNHYHWDSEGNRLTEAHSSPFTNNQVTSFAGNQYKYDAVGNLVEKHIGQHTLLELHYDARNRLAYVERYADQRLESRTYYLYDSLSRRIAKQVIPTVGESYVARYGWDGDNLVHQKEKDTHSTIFYEPGSFVPLFRVDQTASGGKHTHTYTTDHLGTPMQLISEQGQLIWDAEKDDWRAVKNQRAVPGITQPIRFQGQWADEETGLYYNRHRYYDPDMGRYITSDPIGLAGGLNGYEYVASPTGWVDPLGLISFLSGIGRAWQASRSITLEQARQADDITNMLSEASKLPQCVYQDVVLPSQIPAIEDHYRDITAQNHQTNLEACKNDRRNQRAYPERFSLEQIEANYNQCVTKAGFDLGRQTALDTSKLNRIIQEQQDRARKACLPDMPSL